MINVWISFDLLRDSIAIEILIEIWPPAPILRQTRLALGLFEGTCSY